MQLLSLLPPDPLRQATARRVHEAAFRPPYVVANARHAEVISAQLSQCGAPADALILEPAARNTAPAIALAAALAAQTEPDALLLVMRSEEHTSELQSLMRISYAVFCLKQKKILYNTNKTYTLYTFMRKNTTIQY